MWFHFTPDFFIIDSVCVCFIHQFSHALGRFEHISPELFFFKLSIGIIRTTIIISTEFYQQRLLNFLEFRLKKSLFSGHTEYSKFRTNANVEASIHRKPKFMHEMNRIRSKVFFFSFYCSPTQNFIRFFHFHYQISNAVAQDQAIMTHINIALVHSIESKLRSDIYEEKKNSYIWFRYIERSAIQVHTKYKRLQWNRKYLNNARQKRKFNNTLMVCVSLWLDLNKITRNSKNKIKQTKQKKKKKERQQQYTPCLRRIIQVCVYTYIHT